MLPKQLLATRADMTTSEGTIETKSCIKLETAHSELLKTQ